MVSPDERIKHLMKRKPKGCSCQICADYLWVLNVTQAAVEECDRGTASAELRLAVDS